MRGLIRTYSRKPQECRYIEGVMGMCRLCLGPADEAVSIFTDDPSDMCSSLALRIMMCVGFEVERHDCLPNVICLICYKELEQFYAFRKKCEATYQKLKLHTQAIRNRQAIAAITLESEMNMKQMDEEDRNEDIDVNELVMIDGGDDGLSDKLLKVEPTTVCDKQSASPVKTEQNEVQVQESHPPTMDTEELSSLITTVLLKLGVVSEQEGCISVSGDTSRVQLETGDGCVIRMELMEEDEETAEFSYVELPSKSKESSVQPAPLQVAINEPKGKRSSKSTPLRCSVCGRVQSSRSALRRHERTHSGARPFACPTCARSFAQKEVMRRHMLVHEEVRPHQCKSCPKSFTQRGALELHARTHRPPHERSLALHRCPHCPKMFLYSSGLSRHLLTHAGREYSCGACARVFVDKSSALRHMRRADHAPPRTGLGTTQPAVEVVTTEETGTTDEAQITEEP